MLQRALTDLLDFVVDNRGRTCPTAATGTPLIATNCLKAGRRHPQFENVRYVDDHTMSTWFRAHPKPGDVLFVCKGSPGRVAVVPDPVSFCIAQDMVALRANEHVVDPTYLYYRLLAPDVQASIESMHVGTMIPHFKKGDFGKLFFHIHEDVMEQRKVAAVLGALDDKIAANERVIEIISELDLFEALQASRSPACHVRLDSIASVTTGVSYRSVDLAESRNALVTLKSIDRRGAFSFGGFKPYAGDYKSTQALVEGDIIVPQTDLTQKAEVIGRAARMPHIEKFDNLIASLDLAVVRANTHVPQQYLLGVLRQAAFREHCRSRTSGTTVLHLGRGAIESFEFPLASENAMAAYAADSAKRVQLADSLTSANARLVATRDQMLPLLMFGKIRVLDAEQQAEDVL